jgi:hypothetical protein
MSDLDLYSLFMGDEPTAQQRAAAMVQALRGQQAQAGQERLAASLFSLGANPLGQGLVRQANLNAGAAQEAAQQGQGFLAQAGQTRAGHALQRAMQAQQQAFSGEQNAAELAARSRESALNRGLQREQMANALKLQGMRDAADLEERRLATKAAGEAKTVAADEKKRASMTEIMDRYQNIKDQVAALRDQVKADGTWEAVGPHNATMDQKITSIATDMAKLVDPSSVARESEVSAFKSMLFSPGLWTQNDTAVGTLDAFEKMVDQRLGTAYRVRGMEAPQGGSFNLDGTAPKTPGTVRVTNGKETLEIPAADLAAAEADGYRRL